MDKRRCLPYRWRSLQSPFGFDGSCATKMSVIIRGIATYGKDPEVQGELWMENVRIDERGQLLTSTT